MISIRSRLSPSPCATMARSLCSPAAPRNLFNESRGVVEGHEVRIPPGGAHAHRARWPVTIGPGVGSRFRVLPARPHSTIPPQPFAMSGQLASSGFIVVARSFYSSAHFPSSRFNENPSRNDSDLLPGVAEAKKILGS